VLEACSALAEGPPLCAEQNYQATEVGVKLSLSKSRIGLVDVFGFGTLTLFES
jgi:hypothetical protein